MKKIFFTFLTITITIQGYSQTSQQYFHDLRNYFMSLHSESSEIRNRFMDLAQYSSWNSGEHQNMGQGNLANNWNNIRDRFNDLENNFNDSRDYFFMIESKFHEIGNLLGNFDGSYPSLTDRIFYYDSNNNNGIYSNQGNTATGSFSFAIGSSTSASGSSAVSLNHQTAATGNASLAIGSTTQSIGENSFAGGLSTQSTGYSSAALGRETVSSGNHSLSIGQGTNSHAFNSVALGQYNSVSNNADPDTYLTTNTALVIGNGTDTNNRSNAFKVLFDGTTTIVGSVTASSFVGDGSGLTNLPFSYNSNEAGGIEVAGYTTASGSNAFAVGNDNLASGSSSTAMGRGTIASGSDSTAIGANTEASGETATATGQFTSASGKFSLSSGLYSNASGTTSVALGNNTIADGYGTLATGYFNTANSNPQADSFDQSNTAFVIGNGTFENRSNAFKVLFDGTTTIAGDLSINSDARLKANIISLGATLSKLLKIDGKSYTMIKDESEKQKIGLLAQDIEKVFPELVSESNGIKSVNYQGLVPVLINALKEQDVMMKEQQRILSEQQSELDELKSMMQKIIERL